MQTVTASNLAGWQTQVSSDGDATNTASVTFVPGPATPPLGFGSVRLAAGADGGDGAQIRNPNYAGAPVSSLTALAYSTYATGGSGSQAPYIILQISDDDVPGVDDVWFFEPDDRHDVVAAQLQRIRTNGHHLRLRRCERPTADLVDGPRSQLSGYPALTAVRLRRAPRRAAGRISSDDA